MEAISDSKEQIEILSIPHIKRTSLKFRILELLAEEGPLRPGNISWRMQKKLNTIHSTLSILKKMGLVKTGLNWKVMLTKAGEWYVKDYYKELE